MTEEKKVLAKKYAKVRRIISFSETIIFFGIIMILLFTGLSLKVQDIAYDYAAGDYSALLIFLGIIGIAEGIITFPLGFYSEYILEHRYNLSNQTLIKYFTEKLKGLLVGIVIGIPLILAFYYILKKFGNSWWLILGIFMFMVSVVLQRLGPTLIMPLFYKFKPVENESLKNKILEISRKAGVTIHGIFTFDMSRNTKKANAAFTGMGKSKRIILGDTLINNFSDKEIETVFAHEAGHYTKRHLMKLMLLSTVLTFGGLFVTAKLYSSTYGYFGFSGISELAALPLLFLYLSLYSIVTIPVSNIFSRKYEWEADTFALNTTNDKEAFISAMEKLADQNLADKTPNKIIEFLFHSHPSLQKRIDFAKKFNPVKS